MKKPKTEDMKTVLLVDDESLFLASFTEGLTAYRDEFQVITAGNGRQAVDAFDSHDISLVVTDLKMPVMDGFQLLAYLMSSHPHIPVIVMTAFGTPEIEDCIKDFETYGYLEKPIDFQLLADTIRAEISLESSRHLKEIKLFSFLHLLHSEKRTCFLTVKSDGRKGTLYFSKGELLDATFDAMTGDEAAIEILNWQNAEIKIANIFIKMQRRVEKSFKRILLDTMQPKSAANIENGDSLSFEEFNSLLQEIETSKPAESTENGFESQSSEPPFNQTDNAKKAVVNKPKSRKNSQKHSKDGNSTMANNVNESISELMQIDGAMAVALVDARSGMALGSIGTGINLEVAAAGNSEVVKSKLKVMANLGLKDKIEDILITLSSQYHIIRPLSTQPNLFFYLVLNRTNANLAMARFKLSDIEGRVEV